MSASGRGGVCWWAGWCLLVGGVVSASGLGGVCWWAGWCLLMGGVVSAGGWGRVPHHSEDCTISQQQWGTSIVTKLVVLK